MTSLTSLSVDPASCGAWELHDQDHQPIPQAGRVTRTASGWVARFREDAVVVGMHWHSAGVEGAHFTQSIRAGSSVVLSAAPFEVTFS